MIYRDLASQFGHFLLITFSPHLIQIPSPTDSANIFLRLPTKILIPT